MFMHGSLLHLGGNMLFLWIFGNNVEDAMGPVKFLALLPRRRASRRTRCRSSIDPGSPIPTLGASGAVSAVLGGYILLYPRARVVTVIFIVIFFTIIELPAIVVLGLWFAPAGRLRRARLRARADEAGGGVAYFAHIGGFAVRAADDPARLAKDVPRRDVDATRSAARTALMSDRRRSSRPALAFIALLGGLTIAVAVEHGPDVLTVGSLLVLGDVRVRHRRRAPAS